jgi:small subunit ribosomal protein S19
MAKKEFTYRGKTLDELKKLSVDELSKLFTSRVRRKITRGFTEQEKIFLSRIKKKDSVKTHCRDMIVLPEFVGKTVQIYSGKEFKPVKIIPEHIGLRLGEIIVSKARVNHGKAGVGASRSTLHVSVK